MSELGRIQPLLLGREADVGGEVGKVRLWARRKLLMLAQLGRPGGVSAGPIAHLVKLTSLDVRASWSLGEGTSCRKLRNRTVAPS